MKYFAIKVIEADVTRLERAVDARTACRQAFGVIYDRGQAVFKQLPKSPKSMSATKLHEALHSKDGWEPVPRA